MKTSDSLSISPNRQQANVVIEMKVCKETAKKIPNYRSKRKIKYCQY